MPDREQLRLAEPRDLDAIEVVVAAAYESHVRRMGFPPSQLLRDDSALIEAGQIWVLGDPIIAAITLIEIDDTLLVENLAVHPDEQGRGVGRRLMEDAERMASDRGLRRLTLDRNEINRELSDFFGHLGYVELDRRSQYGHRHLVMEKLLAAPS